MTFKPTPNPKDNFRPIKNPDEHTQYKQALGVVLQTLKPRLNAYNGWLCISVWRKAVLDTGDDRLPNGQSLIKKDLQLWDEWLEKTTLSDVQMVSVPLLESSDDYLEDNRFNKVKVVHRQFDAFQSVVDSVSPDMAASHLLWVYKNGLPEYLTIHRGENGDAGSLSIQLENIIERAKSQTFDEIRCRAAAAAKHAHVVVFCELNQITAE